MTTIASKVSSHLARAPVAAPRCSASFNGALRAEPMHDQQLTMLVEHVRVAGYADLNLIVREMSLTTPQATTRSSTPTGLLSPRQRPSTRPPPGTASATALTSRSLPPLSARATRPALSRATMRTTTVRERIFIPAAREEEGSV